MDIRINFNKIEELRKQKKLSMHQVSKLLGYADRASYFYKVVERTTKLSSMDFLKLAVILEVSILDLVEGDDKNVINK